MRTDTPKRASLISLASRALFREPLLDVYRLFSAVLISAWAELRILLKTFRDLLVIFGTLIGQKISHSPRYI